jgi:hypothetical protein
MTDHVRRSTLGTREIVICDSCGRIVRKSHATLIRWDRFGPEWICRGCLHEDEQRESVPQDGENLDAGSL